MKPPKYTAQRLYPPEGEITGYPYHDEENDTWFILSKDPQTSSINHEKVKPETLEPVKAEEG